MRIVLDGESDNQEHRSFLEESIPLERDRPRTHRTRYESTSPIAGPIAGML
jgi:hypothetical protein